MGRFVDLSGVKFGMLTPISKVGSHKKGYAIWECKCDCGNIVNVDSSSLKTGNNKSCGCLMVKMFNEKKTTHGLSSHTLYGVWRGMKQRCSDPLKDGYKNYGGRGISVCGTWKNDFKMFYEWCIENNHKKGLQIDRINNDGNYEPSNCRFVTPKENNSNKWRRK